MISTYTTTGTYGLHHTECTVYVLPCRKGGSWYAIDGSTNVNFTYDDIDGQDLEQLADLDMFTSDAPIESEEDLEREVEDYEQ